MKKYALTISMLLILFIAVFIYEQTSAADHDNDAGLMKTEHYFDLKYFDYNDDVSKVEELSETYVSDNDYPFRIDLSRVAYISSEYDAEPSGKRLEYRIRVSNATDDSVDLSYMVLYEKAFVRKYMYSGTYISMPVKNLASDEGMSLSISDVVADYHSFSEQEKRTYEDFMRTPIVVVEIDGKQYFVELSYDGIIEGINQ